MTKDTLHTDFAISHYLLAWPMQIVSRLLFCVWKSGFTKLTVDLRIKEVRGSFETALSNAFGVHSDDVQDIAMS